MQWSFIPQAYAQNTCDPGNEDTATNLGDCLFLADGTLVKDVYASPGFLVNLVIQNIFVLAGIILFVMIIIAGFKFLQGSSKGKDEARTLITNAIVGFILMFSAYWILQIIQLLTGIDLGVL